MKVEYTITVLNLCVNFFIVPQTDSLYEFDSDYNPFEAYKSCQNSSLSQLKKFTIRKGFQHGCSESL